MEQVDEILKKARAASEAEDIEQAQSLFLDALAVDPANAEVWLWLGRTIREPERAVLYYRRVLQLDPTSAEGRMRLEQALVHVSHGESEVQKPVLVPERKLEEKPRPTFFPLAAELPPVLFGDECSPVTIDSQEVFPSTNSILTSEGFSEAKVVGGVGPEPVWGEEGVGLSLEWEALGSPPLPEAPLSEKTDPSEED